MPGTTVRAWVYNGQMSGPEIRVREGDLVRITLRNELPVGTTIHWHGVNLPPEMDGPVGLNQAAVEPGEEFVYEFVATPAGTPTPTPRPRSPSASTAPSSLSPRSRGGPTTATTPTSSTSGIWS